MPESMKKATRTYAIKTRLQRYARMRDNLDHQSERLAMLEDKMGRPSAVNLTGMPHAPQSNGSALEAQIIRWDELKRQIDTLIEQETQERAELEYYVELMSNPNEMAVIRLRYFDGIGWPEISQYLFSKREDYESNKAQYLNNTYKVHGRALLRLAEVYESSGGET